MLGSVAAASGGKLCRCARLSLSQLFSLVPSRHLHEADVAGRHPPSGPSSFPSPPTSLSPSPVSGVAMNVDLRRHGVGRMNGSKLHGEPQGMLKLVQAKTFVRKFLDKVKDRLFKRAGRTTTDTSEASRGLKKVQKENNYCDLDSYPSYSSDEDYSLEDQKLAEDYSDVIEYLKKYNLLEGYDGIEDVLATDDNLQKRNPLLCLATIRQQLTFNKYNQANFQTAVLDNLFMKHLVEHCSHSEIQEDQALMFHHAFPHLCLPESVAKFRVLHVAYSCTQHGGG